MKQSTSTTADPMRNSKLSNPKKRNSPRAKRKSQTSDKPSTQSEGKNNIRSIFVACCIITIIACRFMSGVLRSQNDSTSFDQIPVENLVELHQKHFESSRFFDSEAEEIITSIR